MIFRLMVIATLALIAYGFRLMHRSVKQIKEGE